MTTSGPTDPLPADEQLPTVTHSGTFRIFGVDVRCHRLSDGRAIIEADSMAELIEAMEAPADREIGDLEAFRRWQESL